MIEFAREAISLRLFIRFLITDSISFLFIGLFRFSICVCVWCVWFSPGRFCISRDLSISSRLSNFLEYNYSKYPTIIPLICRIGSNILTFISDFSNESFFLVHLAKGLSILLIFVKNQLSVSLIFSIIFDFLFNLPLL